MIVIIFSYYIMKILSLSVNTWYIFYCRDCCVTCIHIYKFMYFTIKTGIRVFNNHRLHINYKIQQIIYMNSFFPINITTLCLGPKINGVLIKKHIKQLLKWHTNIKSHIKIRERKWSYESTKTFSINPRKNSLYYNN